MKIFKRVQSLLSASINDLLDKAENPKAITNQIIRDLEEATRELRRNTARQGSISSFISSYPFFYDLQPIRA